MYTYQRTLFIFRQDLRITDNTGLYEAIQQSNKVLPIFVIDDTIISDFPKQDKRLGFLIEILTDLHKQLKNIGGHLYITRGNPVEIIPKITKDQHIDAIFTNKSYGTGSKTRDKQLEIRCTQNDIMRHAYNDFLLLEPDDVKQMKVFTPFYKRRQKQLEERKPKLVDGSYKPKNIENIQTRDPGSHISIQEHNKLFDTLDAGRSGRDIHGWKERLKKFDFTHYEQTRNLLDQDGISKLSPYHRFGLLSIRQLYMHVKNQSNTYVSELARREFWQHIMHYFPATKNQEFQEKRRNLARTDNDEWFTARAEGKTGYPIVDAAMRQLRQENRMHNRARMIVASFLTKDLLIDRRKGEKEFHRWLIDYDENVNIGNRQRSASVGADPKPLRIFSPIRQSERFDPHAIYIKKYIPELKHYTAKQIHDPLNNDLGYAKPIVDHYEMRIKAKEMYMQ